MAYRGLICAIFYAKDRGRLTKLSFFGAGIEPQAIEEGLAGLRTRCSVRR